MKNIVVKVIVKESYGGHMHKLDSFSASPEKAVDTLLKKYVGKNGFERLGNLIAQELRNND